MPTRKVQINLRLDPDLAQRIDELLDRLYRPMPAPSRNAVIEQWVREGLERAEAKLEAEKRNS